MLCHFGWDAQSDSSERALWSDHSAFINTKTLAQRKLMWFRLRYVTNLMKTVFVCWFMKRPNRWDCASPLWKSVNNRFCVSANSLYPGDCGAALYLESWSEMQPEKYLFCFFSAWWHRSVLLCILYSKHRRVGVTWGEREGGNGVQSGSNHLFQLGTRKWWTAVLSGLPCKNKMKYRLTISWQVSPTAAERIATLIVSCTANRPDDAYLLFNLPACLFKAFWLPARQYTLSQSSPEWKRSFFILWSLGWD